MKRLAGVAQLREHRLPKPGVAFSLDHAVRHGASRPAQALQLLADIRELTRWDTGDERDRLAFAPGPCGRHTHNAVGAARTGCNRRRATTFDPATDR
ncbi:MAG: hypothetical protein JHC53_01960 [Thermoleophilia bacterium]|nr:hypothetical protein [Thermoleophilia bacterium]